MNDPLERRLRAHAAALRTALLAEPVELPAGRGPVRKKRWKRTVLLAAALAALLGVSSLTVAGWSGFDFAAWITGAAGESLDQEILAGELERGQWVDLNGRQIAVVLPDSPTRILLSHDGGNTWRESVVEGSDVGYHLGRLWTDVHYADGFISLNEDGTGALVLATGVTMSRQDARCFLTEDSGETWREIAPDTEERLVVTGVGYSSAGVLTVGHIYYVDSGPTLRYTDDGGATWHTAEVYLPAEYAQYHYTPRTIVFDGQDGVCSVTALCDGAERTLRLTTDDGGYTWTLDP